MIIYQIHGIGYDEDRVFGYYVDKYIAEAKLEQIMNSDVIYDGYYMITIQEIQVNTETI